MAIKDISIQHFEKRRKNKSQENMDFRAFFEILLKFSVQLSVSITQCSIKNTFFAK